MNAQLEPVGRSIIIAGTTAGHGLADRQALTDTALQSNDRVFTRCTRLLGWEWADNTAEMMDRQATEQCRQAKLAFELPGERAKRTRANVREYAIARGVAPETMVAWVLVADFYPYGVRRAGVSFLHHVEAWREELALPDALQWLAKAEDEQWTVPELRAAIRSSRPTPEVKEPDAGEDLPREVSQFESWAATRWTEYRQVAALDAIRLLNELQNAAKLLDHLRARAQL